MNKTKIEWCDRSWNPVTGCKGDCEYCYARRISMRFHRSFEPQFHKERINEPYKLKEPARIFTVSMGDLFGDWVPESWINEVLEVIDFCPQHDFMILTKNPKRLAEFYIPMNAWIGITVDSREVYKERLHYLLEASAYVKFISFEPLLTPIDVNASELKEIDWVIIGGKTGNKPFIPPREWADKIIKPARSSGIAVFLKNNLHYPVKIQEFPL